jgi:hypothetical protein
MASRQFLQSARGLCGGRFQTTGCVDKLSGMNRLNVSTALPQDLPQRRAHALS